MRTALWPPGMSRAGRRGCRRAARRALSHAAAAPPGYMAAPATVLSYPWAHFICGHLGRLATRDDVPVHQAYIADIEASVKEALASVDPVPYYMHDGENAWAGIKAHLDTVEAGRPWPPGDPCGWRPAISIWRPQLMHLVFIVAGFSLVKEDDMPSTLIPTCVPCGLCFADGRLLGWPIREEHRQRGRLAEPGHGNPGDDRTRSPALAVHPADAAQHPSCPIPRMR